MAPPRRFFNSLSRFVVLNLVCGGRRLIDGGLEAIDRLLLDAFRQLLSTFLNECLHVVDGS